MQKAVISGATGYIGSNLARRLVSLGYDVYIISRKQSNYSLLSDIIDRLYVFEYSMKLQDLIVFFETTRPDMVCHLASLATYNYDNDTLSTLIQSNIEFSTHILEAMLKTNTKNFINTGSYSQNYDSEKYSPACLYAATKEAFEKILEYYVECENFKAITLKLYDTYGLNDNRNKLITLLNVCAKTGDYLDMSLGEQNLNIVYIDDVIDAYMKALSLIEEQKNGTHKKYFISSQTSINLKEIVRVYEKINDIKLNINWGKRPYRNREIFEPYIGEKLPGWFPKFSLEDGLKMLKSHSILCSDSMNK